MEDLQKRIGYTFKNTDLLTEALTHSSYANEHKAKHIKYNERLEFLGDAVLSIVVSDYIFKHCMFLLFFVRLRQITIPRCVNRPPAA